MCYGHRPHTENQIKDVASLHSDRLPRLTVLDLHHNLLSSLGSIRLPTLTHLYLVPHLMLHFGAVIPPQASNNITRLDGVAALVSLQRLHLRGNKVHTHTFSVTE
jgi:Leucine-rich repeat (LRR) protein